MIERNNGLMSLTVSRISLNNSRCSRPFTTSFGSSPISRRMAPSDREATTGAERFSIWTLVRCPGPLPSSTGPNPTMLSERKYFPYPRGTMRPLSIFTVVLLSSVVCLYTTMGAVKGRLRHIVRHDLLHEEIDGALRLLMGEIAPLKRTDEVVRPGGHVFIHIGPDGVWL